MNGVLLIICKDTPVNFIGTTVSELMDRINETHLEDPLSEHNLYNMDRKANIDFWPIPDSGWLAMTIDLPFLDGAEIGDVSQGQLGILMLEKGNDGMYGIKAMRRNKEGAFTRFSRLKYSGGARALSVLFHVLEKPLISIDIYQRRGEKYENSIRYIGCVHGSNLIHTRRDPGSFRCDRGR